MHFDNIFQKLFSSVAILNDLPTNPLRKELQLMNNWITNQNQGIQGLKTLDISSNSNE